MLYSEGNVQSLKSFKCKCYMEKDHSGCSAGMGLEQGSLGVEKRIGLIGIASESMVTEVGKGSCSEREFERFRDI